MLEMLAVAVTSITKYGKNTRLSVVDEMTFLREPSARMINIITVLIPLLAGGMSAAHDRQRRRTRRHRRRARRRRHRSVFGLNGVTRRYFHSLEVHRLLFVLD